MNEIIKGKIVTLSPATFSDRLPVYQWLAESDLTPLMIGEPNYPEQPVPTWEEFVNDYADYFFDSSKPLHGRCFIIEVKGKPVGQVNHDIIHPDDKSTELDIWLSNSKQTGKGYGTDALIALCDYLYQKFKCQHFYIAPSARNKAAIKSYHKAGFTLTDKQPVDFKPDYRDTVVMIKSYD